MYSPQALWSAAHYKSRVIFFRFNNARYNVLMNVAKGSARRTRSPANTMSAWTWSSRASIPGGRWQEHGRAVDPRRRS